ncbi:MAG TPA: hypothetical protein VHV49_17195, partial [Pseudonocardiaceae bacterium]|nr:hypothetical protein [Pseudonocardiaceae bacterium]
MTPPDKPDTADAPTETTRDERAVATASPAVEAETTTGTNGTPKKQPAAAKPEAETKPAAKPAAQAAEKPTAPTQPAAAKPATAKPAAEPEPAKPMEGSDITSSAPPPWQRVANDTQ